ncbi:MAG: hypothetical protein ACOY9D_02165 [Pseudomonadota bacterium]
MVDAASLNADAQSARIDRASLEAAVRAQGVAFQEAISAGHEHLFADTVVFVTATQVRQMGEVIAAVERVVKLPGWMKDAPLPQRAPHLNPLPLAGEEANEKGNLQSLGVFYGYDFHLNEQGAHLIEINTNAGGGFLNALLIESQRDAMLYGSPSVHADASTSSAQGTPSVSKHESSPFDTSGRTDVSLDDVFIEMFRNEWRLARGDATLKNVAIVDEQPEAQYLFPEFLLAKAMFERAGIAAYIADPSALQPRDDGLYLDGNTIDLVYNRLTDFSLQRHPALRKAYSSGQVVLTPNPAHYARYADKRNLARLSDADGLRTFGAKETDIGVLQSGVPHTIPVLPGMEWSERKQWFFKPNSGYGGKGAYSGEKLTKRVFGEILQSDYVAQKLAPPGERSVCLDDGEAVPLKYDVRCYVYDGQIQLVAARLYQGQTTNFRTPGGGFALVRVVG